MSEPAYSFCFYDEDGHSAGCMWPGTYKVYPTTFNEELGQTSLRPYEGQIVYLPEPSASLLLAVGLVGLVVLGTLRCTS